MTDLGVASIEYVKFSITSDYENKLNAVVQINKDGLLNSNGAPINNGLYDLRLGTTDHNSNCITCHFDKKLCNGHRGYAELSTPLYNPIAISEIRKWYRAICLNCGAVMIDPEKLKRIPISKRLDKAINGNDIRRCRECNKLHPKIEKDSEDRFTFIAIYVKDNEMKTSRLRDILPNNVIGVENVDVKIKLIPALGYKIFKRVTQETVDLLGVVTHPINLLVKNIVIPPNTIRPSTKNHGTDSGSSHQDSTAILQHIIRGKNLIDPKKVEDQVENLIERPNEPIDKELDKSMTNQQQCYYDLILGSDNTNAMQGNTGKRGITINNKPAQSLLRDLPGKEKLIRNNTLGKRVFVISRSTISGNSAYRPDELGIPLEYAKKLYVTEYVQPYNIEFLTAIFLNGTTQYPGCSYVIKRSTGEKHDVSRLKDYHLEVGDILHRDAMDGDVGYFNRMPTLSRCSIGVHTIKIIRDPSIHTFMVNVIICNNYNADFDGDQMHLFISRGIEQRVEGRIMSNVSNWFISTKTGGIMNGQVQDSVVGLYQLSRRKTRVSKQIAQDLLCNMDVDEDFSKYSRDHIFTGREIISMVLKKTPITYRKKLKALNDIYKPYISFFEDETELIIENGVMISGILDSSTIGAKKGGLYHLISKEYGTTKTFEQIYAMQHLALRYLMIHGFTIGVDDLILDDNAYEKIDEAISEMMVDSKESTNRLLAGDIIPPINTTIHDYYEFQQKEALKVDATRLFSIILSHIDMESNGLFICVFTGAKGQNNNMITMMGIIGQVNADNERITNTSFFPKYSLEPEAHGFVSGCYIRGVTVTELAFSASAGRNDLVCRAIVPAVTGYFMRKSIMNHETSITNEHRSVKKKDYIIQLLYGEDGLDSRYIEDVKYKPVLMDNDQLKTLIYPDEKLDEKLTAICDKWYNKVKEQRDEYRSTFIKIEGQYTKPMITDIIQVPVNISRMVLNILRKSNKTIERQLTIDKINKVLEFIELLPYVFYNDMYMTRRRPISPRYMNATTLVKMLIMVELSPKIISTMSQEELDFILHNIRNIYSESLIEYGVAVGILAVQSISEPITQYMLNSHHRSAGGGTSKDGLKRINEIYSAKKAEDEQTATMVIPINEKLQNRPDINIIAKKIAANIGLLKFRMFIQSSDGSCEIIKEPIQKLITQRFRSDNEWINNFMLTHPLIKIPNDLTDWSFRFVIDRLNLTDKLIDLETIVQRLIASHSNIFVVHSPETSEEIVIRVWFRQIFDKKKPIDEYYQMYLDNILDTIVRGIDNITDTKAEVRKHYTITKNGAFEIKDRYVITTTGSNLYSVCKYKDLFDVNNIVSNSTMDTYNMYGIEAARSKLIAETNAITESDDVNKRHIMLYADEMTRTGQITSIEKGGLTSREYQNVLLRASYADPIKTISNEALNNTTSPIYGLVAPRLLGAIPKVGTNYTTVVMNEEFIQKNVQSLDNLLDMI